MSDNITLRVKAESGLIRTLGAALRTTNKTDGIATLSDLLVKALTGIPFAGALAGESIRIAMATSAWGKMNAELAMLEAEQEQEAFAELVGRVVAQTIGHSLQALMVGQQEILDAIGELDSRLDGVGAAALAAIQVESIRVASGGVGIQGMPEKRRTEVDTIHVGSGGIGLNFGSEK